MWERVIADLRNLFGLDVAPGTSGGASGGGGIGPSGLGPGSGGRGGGSASAETSSHPVNAGLPAEGRAFLDTIAGTESAGEYNIQNGGGHFSGYGSFHARGRRRTRRRKRADHRDHRAAVVGLEIVGIDGGLGAGRRPKKTRRLALPRLHSTRKSPAKPVWAVSGSQSGQRSEPFTRSPVSRLVFRGQNSHFSSQHGGSVSV